jgi:putative chitinase
MSTETALISMGVDPKIALAVEQACIRYGIDTVDRKAYFIGQLMAESNLRMVRENMNYSASALARVWPGRYAHPDGSPNKRARELAHDPVAIAEATYGGRMGNGPEGSGDGWKFRGNGPGQITGKNNHRAYSMAQYGDDRILREVDSLTRLPDGVYSAAYHWSANGFNALADKGDQFNITQRWNGGQTGADHRKRATEKTREAFTALLQ